MPVSAGRSQAPIIRSASEAEAERIARVMATVIASLDFYSPEARVAELAKFTAPHLLELMDQHPDRVLIAADEERILGFCVSKDDDGLLWLSWFGVVPEARGLGLGNRLVDEFVARTKAAGIHKVWCDARTENRQSRRLLAEAGFKEICVLRNHWYGQDYVLLERLT